MTYFYFISLFFFEIIYNLDEQQFWKACEDGDLEDVGKFLQNLQLNINWQNYLGETPFYVACAKNHIEIVKLLLNEKRISTRKKMNEGKTAIDIAKEEKHSNIVKLIKEFDTGNHC